eukprot:TRINITY_DN7382_c0_g1_i1.p1 TRINITY_DN7382_c0_g1~~TRINITY_DN7382_c0_g1_i1.p1  ORF type:complete len:370 (-),score=160.11 TRINITY_DN7382_c0_g1_i1:124-1233(-)
MSCSSAIPASDELVRSFANGNSAHRFLLVKIENEVLVLKAVGAKTASLANDWAEIPRVAEREGGPCYVVVRTGSEKEWCNITFVPESTKVKDKMVYASTKATLQRHLGFQFFSEEKHANTISELTYEFYTGSNLPVYSLSKGEESRIIALKDEDREREERVQQLGGKKRLSCGYHAVQIPLTDSARSSLSQFSSGAANFVELKINDRKDAIEGVGAQTVSTAVIASKITTTEPRYYVYKWQAKTVSLYVCPGNAPRPLRMVYSTSKPAFQSNIEATGIRIDKSAELDDGSELNEAYFQSLFSRPAGVVSAAGGAYRASGMSSSGGAAARPRPTSVIAGAHPIYSLMGQGQGQTDRKPTKKIVIPPSGAW